METPQPSYRYQYGGKMVSTKIVDPTFMDIGQFSKVADIPIIFFSIVAVDVLVLFLSRYFPTFFGKNLNRWYDEFGLSAVLADVLIILIGFLIARYIWSSFFQEKYGWNFLYFVGLLVFVQLIHDLFFYFAIIKPIPKGHNDMIDVFKDYAEGGGRILLGDAGLMAASAALAAFAKGFKPEWQIAGAVFATYCLPYILYTQAK